MQRDPRKYLHDMLDSCNFVSRFCANRTLDDLRNERGFRSAVERELQIIGEALFNLNKWAPEVASQIDQYQRIIRFRHILVHGYDIVDRDITWTIIADKLPLLTQQVSQLLLALDRRPVDDE